MAEKKHLSELTHVELLAVALEYEHALQHVADRHDTWVYCFDCQRLAQSALDRVNGEDFLEWAVDMTTRSV